jgi:late competence protein required for DNA uptake (superfamily II DNA/RNA helicase)
LVLDTKIKLDDLNLPRENLEVQLQDTVRLLKAWKRCSYCGNENLKTIILTPNGEIVCQKCGTVLGRTFISSDSNARVEERRATEPLCDEERTLEDHVSKYGWDFL